MVFGVSSATCEPQHFASCVELSKCELQVVAQQIRADLDRIDGGTGTASSSHTAGATANGCHDGHGQAARAGNPTERSTAGRDERNLDGTQYEGIEVGSGPVAGPKDPPQGATLRRASDWKTCEFQRRVYLIAQDKKYRELFYKIDDPTKDVHNGDLNLENHGRTCQEMRGKLRTEQRDS